MSIARHNQFYLTLPSNSSMGYYPKNSVTNYTTHFPSTISLPGGVDGAEWEIALVEAHYPCSFLAIGNDAKIFIYTKPSADIEDSEVTTTTLVVVKVEPDNYKNIDELLDTINNNVKIKLHGIEFEYDKDVKRVELIAMNSTLTQLELSSTLALVMGYDVHNVDLKKFRKASRPPNLLAGIPADIYVYCDLVEPQLVGDTVAPLLKIVNIDTNDYKYGSHKVVHFITPHYLPVIKTSFESVEIDLRDDKGNRLPFEFGTTYMKLHLRRAPTVATTTAV